MPHKSGHISRKFDLKRYNALIITTSQGSLDKLDEQGNVLKKGGATGVYASEMTEPYYSFKDAGLTVDIASIKGGKKPIEKSQR